MVVLPGKDYFSPDPFPYFDIFSRPAAQHHLRHIPELSLHHPMGSSQRIGDNAPLKLSREAPLSK